MVTPSRPARFRALAAVPVAAVLLGACSSAEVSRFHRFSDDTYLQRGEPARILPGAPRDLSDEGYVLLGHVEVQQPVRTCEETRCWEYTHERSGRDSALQLAAERGGDVILLSKDGVLEREVTERQGRCKVPAHGPGSLRPKRRSLMPEDCWEYEAIPRVRELRVTEGYVWRHEPDRVNDGSRALWRRWFEERPRVSTREQEGPAENTENSPAP